MTQGTPKSEINSLPYTLGRHHLWTPDPSTHLTSTIRTLSLFGVNTSDSASDASHGGVQMGHQDSAPRFYRTQYEGQEEGEILWQHCVD